MRKIKAIVMIITAALLLTSCAKSGAGNAESIALDMRAMYLAAERLDMTLEVTADYGERVYKYKFKYTGNASSGEIEIKEPEAIAGLKAEVSVTGGKLIYDGAELDTGAITGDGMSPAQVVPVLINQWQTGYISSCRTEKVGDDERIVVTTAISDTVSQCTWFELETLIPVRSEISSEGHMVIACVFENVIVE